MARKFLSGIDLLGQLATAIGATLSSGKLLGRSTAGTGAIEEISIGSGLSLSAGTLSATGGGLTHFVESESTSAPNATVPVDALTATDASYTNIDVAFVAKGTGATLAQVPTGTTAGGNKRGTYATDFQKSRSAIGHVASGTNSVICGGANNSASGARGFIGAGDGNLASASDSVAVGGSSCTASGTSSFTGGGSSNNASGIGAAVVGGGSNNANKVYSCVVGGNGNTANGDYSFVGGGANNSATLDYSVVPGGRFNTANGIGSSVLGGYYGTARGIAGYCVFPASNSPLGGILGAVQAALLNLSRQTTDNTPTVLASNSSAAGSANQVTLPNNSAYSFSGEVIAGVTGGGNTARWTISGAIKRGANAASTAMVGTPTVTMSHNDAGASAWVVAVTADTTNGGIKVEVTGAASTTIRWVCKIETTEMTF